MSIEDKDLTKGIVKTREEAKLAVRTLRMRNQGSPTSDPRLALVRVDKYRLVSRSR